MKYAYVGLMGGVSLLALAAAAFAGLDLIHWALMLLSLAVAVLPLLDHLRMRRELQAIKRFSRGSGKYAVVDDNVERVIGKIQEEVATISKNVEALPKTVASQRDDVILAVANEVRRESRMIRIVANGVRESVVQRQENGLSSGDKSNDND